MYHTFRNYIKSPAAAAYLRVLSADAEHMYNTANFYVRNTMTGLAKEPSGRTANETFVLKNVRRGIGIANEKADRRFRGLVLKAGLADMVSAVSAMRTIRKALGIRFFRYPDKDRWFLDYGTLDAIFKAIDDPVYRRMPAQVNQNCIRKLCSSWKGYFSSRKKYAAHPDTFNGEPKLPGYRHTGHGTVWMTNQACKAVRDNGRMYLTFPESPVRACLGKMIPAGWKFTKAEVKWLSGRLALLSTFGDASVMPEVPEHPERILGIDIGLDNLMAAGNNFGQTPLIIKGSWLKSSNQWAGKRMAELRSALMKGHDPKTYHPPVTHRMEHLSRKRDDRIRDFLYKACRYVCRYAVMNHVDVIVFGYNAGWKDGTAMSKQNNQRFVSVPFLELRTFFVNTAAEYGIPVVVREESYTSQASFPDRDDIPTYKDRDTEKHHFSGRRIRRGLYRSADGTVLNADINGAANIIRKEYPYAFDGQDVSYLYRTIYAVTKEALYGEQPGTITFHPSKKSTSAQERHTQRSLRRTELRQVFPPEKKAATAAA